MEHDPVALQIHGQPEAAAIWRAHRASTQAIRLDPQADVPPLGMKFGVGPWHNANSQAIQMQRLAGWFPASQGWKLNIISHFAVSARRFVATYLGLLVNRSKMIPIVCHALI
jgi:hypothetical protein